MERDEWAMKMRSPDIPSVHLQEQSAALRRFISNEGYSPTVVYTGEKTHRRYSEVDLHPSKSARNVIFELNQCQPYAAYRLMSNVSLLLMIFVILSRTFIDLRIRSKILITLGAEKLVISCFIFYRLGDSKLISKGRWADLVVLDDSDE